MLHVLFIIDSAIRMAINNATGGKKSNNRWYDGYTVNLVFLH